MSSGSNSEPVECRVVVIASLSSVVSGSNSEPVECRVVVIVSLSSVVSGSNSEPVECRRLSCLQYVCVDDRQVWCGRSEETVDRRAGQHELVCLLLPHRARSVARCSPSTPLLVARVRLWAGTSLFCDLNRILIYFVHGHVNIG